jgi:hypothetical protein
VFDVVDSASSFTGAIGSVNADKNLVHVVDEPGPHRGSCSLRAIHVDVAFTPLITEHSLDNNRTTHDNRTGRQRICQVAERIEDVNIAANDGTVALQSALHAMEECIAHGSIVITFVFLVRTEEMFVGTVQVVDVSGRMCTVAYQLKHITWYICQPFHVGSMVVPSVKFAFGTAVGAATHQIVDPPRAVWYV